ncbi:helix-turn-helix domain-containing protein [Taylorella equigenitalis]|uniref:helix-turn-helix transcriptional regulator n=1 Tax=Taylorella equigenitalis TaxID=29575 RepID=UPI00237D3152|nr:helix-turn-helix domain-containing protein [Taylorella equigenitalis]WDU48702.1 helix-turn-helix domain-containing protein [Taylorella equigenitalis]WDU51178.1 helix-turn-helix domain-containing protein [Taylorella equigenitalis]
MNNEIQDLRLFTINEVAQVMGVKKQTIYTWLHRKQMPEPDIKLKRYTRWKYPTIKPFLENREKYLNSIASQSQNP